MTLATIHDQHDAATASYDRPFTGALLECSLIETRCLRPTSEQQQQQQQQQEEITMTRSQGPISAAAFAAAAVAISTRNAADAFVPSTHHHVSSSPSVVALSAGSDGKQKKPRRRESDNNRFASFTGSSGRSGIDDDYDDYDDAAVDVATPRSVMQGGKSIEELEAIMSKRWGTSDDKWTVDFDEEELVYGDGDDDDKYDNNSGTSSSRSPKNDVSGKKFKAKPVLDPWQKAEAQAERERIEKEQQSKKKRDKSAADKGRSSVFGGAGGEDAVLDRVRRNQEKLRQEREAKVAANAPKKDRKKQQQEQPMEFYDEDDEGYEGSYANEEEGGDVAFDSIISPQPASRSERRQTKKKGRGNDSSAGGGFFFRPASDAENFTPADDANDEQKQQARKKKDRAPRQPAKVGEDGNEMLLTLAQADKNVDEYLASLTTDDSAGFADEDDPLTVNDWEDIGITDAKLLHNLRQRMRCPQPLSVQDKASPPILSESDVLVSTHTGSGKTLAFLAPLAQRLLIDAAAEQTDQGVKIVIVAPGRELASQIVSVARELLEGTGLKVLLTIGGTPFSRSIDSIRKKKPDVIVGTPGRIAELIVGQPGAKSGRMKIASLQTIVLDEFDALLEYEPHRDPTVALMQTLKRRHGDSLQSVLCSATAADMMGKDLLNEMLRPGFAHAQVDEGDRLVTSVDGEEKSRKGCATTRVSRTAIHGFITIPDRRLKLETLRRVLYTEPTPQQVLVFVDNSRRVGIVVDKLAQMGIVAAPLHGGSGSEKTDRAEVSKALREGFVGIVVATELAARGIDAPYLTHVVNLDLPTDASHYAHRAGRCGRGGRPGVVVNIAAGPKEKRVPNKFASALGIEMNCVEPRAGKLVILEEGDEGTVAES